MSRSCKPTYYTTVLTIWQPKRLGSGCCSLKNGLESLKYDPDGTKLTQDLGPDDVLVELRAASLNYRELLIAQAPILPSLILGSESGRTLAIGSAVAFVRPELKPGVDVVTHMCPHIDDDLLPDFEAVTGRRE
ncbi:hypothetical protein GGS21DRAFT_489290 [Xylaria nigripes]|nr:hypothetical protein GGS21DRAFT_489290 [Xylaria nigripes]